MTLRKGSGVRPVNKIPERAKIIPVYEFLQKRGSEETRYEYQIVKVMRGSPLFVSILRILTASSHYVMKYGCKEHEILNTTS